MKFVAAPYANAGNALVLQMIPKKAVRILDVGCGSGDIARRIKEVRPQVEVIGLTHSSIEAKIAALHMDAVHVVDLEDGLVDVAMAEWGSYFDLIIFSHVLEHLTDPVSVIRSCLNLMQPSGHVLIAVPNVLEWRTRMQFLRGDFKYTDCGILDRTHIRFFTYLTAPRELLDPIADLVLIEQKGRGSIPLWFLRRIPAGGLWEHIDRACCTFLPNFCCSETALLARWDPSTP